MLYCNDELVKINEPEWSHLKEEFAAIRKMKNPIRIKTTQKIEINNGHVEPVPAHSWPLKAMVINPDGFSETWRYTANTPVWEGDNLRFTKSSIQIDYGLLVLDPIKETDKAYFIIKLSGLLKSGLYEIENIDAKNSQEVEKIGANAAVEYFVCNKYSPLYNDHSKLRQLASSWGIGSAGDMHIDTVRKMLVDRVYSGQRNYAVTKRGIEEFVSEVNGEDPFTEYRTIIQLALDKSIIGWNDKDRGWYFIDETTKSFVQPLVFIQPSQLSQKNVILFDYIRMNANLFETIKESLGDSYIGNSSNTEGNSYSHLSWPAKKKLATSRGIKVFGKTEKEIVQELVAQDGSKVEV